MKLIPDFDYLSDSLDILSDLNTIIKYIREHNIDTSDFKYDILPSADVV